MKVLIKICYCSLFISLTYANEIKVGVVPQFDHRTIQSIWEPILHELELDNQLKYKLVGSPSISDFEVKFEKGEFDFVYLNPYHLLVAHQKQGYYPILRDIGRELYGIIVTKSNTPIESIEGLNDKKVAFPSPNALGAALIPRAEFAMKYMISPIYLYVNSHDSVYLNVILGKVDAGGGVQKTFNQQPEYIKNKLKIIYETERVAPHPIAVHPRVDKGIVEGFKRTFYKCYRNEVKKIWLEKIPIKVLGEARIEDYNSLKEMGLESFYVRK